MNFLHKSAWMIISIFLSVLNSPLAANSYSEDSLLQTAPGRIEKYRMAPVDIAILDKNGYPLSGAIVRIEQKRHAFLFGCNIFPLYRFEGEKHQTYARHFSDVFNYATLGFYWGSYEPTEGDISKARDYNHRVAEWCKTYGIETKGHPLVWHEVYPKWGPSDPERTKEFQKKRIESIMPDYKGLIDRWDVINEATAASQFKTGVSNWIVRDGALAVTKATLDWARKTDPSALLVYNDYKIDSVHFQLISDLVKANAPFDIIGLQSHMHTGEWNLEKAWNICEQYKTFGKPIHFTEMTVISGQHGWQLPRPWNSTPEGEKAQADYVKKIYTLLFSHPSVEAITWWDLQDGSWMGAPSGLLRDDLSAKPAYDELRKLIKEVWWTRQSLTSDKDGKCSFSGFLGEYQVTLFYNGQFILLEKPLRQNHNSWIFKTEW